MARNKVRKFYYKSGEKKILKVATDVYHGLLSTSMATLKYGIPQSKIETEVRRLHTRFMINEAARTIRRLDNSSPDSPLPIENKKGTRTISPQEIRQQAIRRLAIHRSSIRRLHNSSPGNSSPFENNRGYLDSLNCSNFPVIDLTSSPQTKRCLVEEVGNISTVKRAKCGNGDGDSSHPEIVALLQPEASASTSTELLFASSPSNHLMVNDDSSYVQHETDCGESTVKMEFDNELIIRPHLEDFEDNLSTEEVLEEDFKPDVSGQIGQNKNEENEHTAPFDLSGINKDQNDSDADDITVKDEEIETDIDIHLNKQDDYLQEKTPLCSLLSLGNRGLDNQGDKLLRFDENDSDADDITVKEEEIETDKDIHSNNEDNYLQEKTPLCSLLSLGNRGLNNEDNQLLRFESIEKTRQENDGSDIAAQSNVNEHSETQNNVPVNGIKKCRVVIERLISKFPERDHVNQDKTHTEKPIGCLECSETFSYDFSEDGKPLVTECKPHVCSVCNEIFHCKWSLLSHQKVHSDEEIYKCVFCYAEFYNVFDLSNHLFIHRSLKSYRCTICRDEFTNKSSLSEHLRIHSNGVARVVKYRSCRKKFVQPYECKICYNLVNKSNYSYHKKVHKSTRQYVCNVCSEVFSNQSNLSEHMSVHS